MSLLEGWKVTDTFEGTRKITVIILYYHDLSNSLVTLTATPLVIWALVIRSGLVNFAPQEYIPPCEVVSRVKVRVLVREAVVVLDMPEMA